MRVTLYETESLKDVPSWQKAYIKLVGVLKRVCGINVELHDTLSFAGSDGYFDRASNTVHLSLDSMSYGGTIAHELTHFIEMWSPEGWNAIRDEANKRDVHGWESLLAKREEQYGAENAESEAVAGMMEGVLADETAVREFCQQNETVGRKILEWLGDLLDQLKAAFANDKNDASSKWITDTGKAFDLWANALNEASSAAEGRQAGALSGKQMKLRQNAKGQWYVEADRKVLTGNDPATWAAQIDSYITGLLDRDGKLDIATQDGEIITLDSKHTAWKMSYHDPQYSDAEYGVKGRAAVHVDELATLIEKDDKIFPDKGYEHDDFARNGWKYRTVFFRDFDGKHYKLTLSIAMGEGGKTLYNIGKIEERRSDDVSGPSGNAGATVTESLSHSMPADSGIVNPNTESSQTTRLDAISRQSGKQMRLRSFEDGTKYVEIERDQDIFEGIAEREMPSVARSYIKTHFKGNYIGEGEARAHISLETANEYAYPAARKDLSKAEKEAKMRAATELDNLITASQFIDHSNDDGRHPQAVNGWDKYKTIFEVSGRYFEGVVNILNGDGWRRLYDVTKIKDVTNATMGLSDRSRNAQSVGDNKSMPQSEQNVKRFRLRPALQAGKERLAAMSPEDAKAFVSMLKPVGGRAFVDPIRFMDRAAASPEVRKTMYDLLEKPFNEAGGEYGRGLQRRSDEYLAKVKELGIGKAESKAVQRYGEGVYQDEYGELHEYTEEMLKKDFPDTRRWRKASAGWRVFCIPNIASFVLQ